MERLHDEATKALASCLSRRELLGRAGKGAAGLAALTLLSGPVGAATRLERLLPGVRELDRVRAQAALGDTLPDLQLPFWGDGVLWDQPQDYETIQQADIDGDGQADLTIRGPVAQLFLRFDKDTGQWLNLPEGPGFSDAGGWDQPKWYRTIHFGDIDPKLKEVRRNQRYALFFGNAGRAGLTGPRSRKTRGRSWFSKPVFDPFHPVDGLLVAGS